MDIESFREYCINKKGATESFPFPKLPDVLVFKVGGKMFAVTDIAHFTAFTVKCAPGKVEELRAKYVGVEKPSYMSPKHWNSVAVNEGIPDKLLQEWIDDSYKLIVSKLPKVQRENL